MSLKCTLFWVLVTRLDIPKCLAILNWTSFLLEHSGTDLNNSLWQSNVIARTSHSSMVGVSSREA